MGLDPHSDLAAVLACDTTRLGLADLVAVLAPIRRLRGLLDSVEAGINTRLGELHEQGSGASAADVLTRNSNISAKEAARRERRAKALAKTKAFGDALARGTVTAEHADVLADLTAKVTDSVRDSFFDLDQQLTSEASATSPERFARHCRQVIARLERDEGIERNRQQRRDTHLTISVQHDGMYRINGLLHPELGEQVSKAVDVEVSALAADNPDQLDHGQLAAQALGNAWRRPLRGWPCTWSPAAITPPARWKPTCW